MLQQAGDIVEVDLARQEVAAGPHVDRALSRHPGQAGVRLQDVGDVFVSVLGGFRVTDKTAESTTFHAPFGGGPDGPGVDRVRIVCAAAGLRRTDLPSGRARRLGLVEDRDAATRTLTVHPIAVFR